MCGIVFVKRLDRANANKQIAKRYSKQQHRGSDGFGYIGRTSKGTVSPLQRTQFEHEIKQKLQASTLSEILFHHRYPTSTPNVPESAHPLLVANHELKYNYYVTHNGVITNDDKLKDMHEALGYTYLTEVKTQYRTRKGKVYTSGVEFNDSEAFAIELARTIEGLQPEALAEGAIAYIAYQVEKINGNITAVYFGTNGGNPLTLQWTKEFIAIASEGGKAIDANKSFRLDADTNELVQVPVKLQDFTKRMGYQTTMYGASLEDAREFTDVGRHRKNHWPDNDIDTIKANVRGYKLDEELSLVELEEAISEVDDDIIGTQGDADYCLQTGDDDTEYQQDIQNLFTRRDKLARLYERKGNTQ